MRLVLIYALAGAIVGALYVLLQGGTLDGVFLRGIPIGTAIAASIAAFEVWVVGRPPRRWFTALPFLAALAIRTAFYGAAITGSLILAMILAPSADHTASEYIRSSNFLGDVAFSFGTALTFNFLNALRELVGGRKLLNVMTGRYHHPRREERIFLFIDMKDSTVLAEKMGAIAFHGLLADFYEDVARAILKHGGEIDRYIGDEILASWWLNGRHRTGAYLAVAEASRSLCSRAEFYRNRHGTLPGFRAGLHCGPVVAGELGVGRREIGFVGDAINTAARIEQTCRTLEEDILASLEMLDTTPLPIDLFEAVELPPVPLRGKSEPLRLVALHLKQRSV